VKSFFLQEKTVFFVKIGLFRVVLAENALATAKSYAGRGRRRQAITGDGRFP